MKNINKIIGIPNSVFFACSILISVSSCTKTPDSPGHEYMPDMYRSPSIETYVNYAHPDSMMSRQTVEGTVPYSLDPSKKLNSMPYPYANTSEGYEAAGANLKNPLEKSNKNTEEGKVLYTKFCVHCHGDQGNGDGSLVANDKFPPPPAYNKIAGLTEGKMFHTMTYGKGLMGSHASQLNKEERWKLVLYVQKLQGPAIDAAPADTTKK